MIRPRSRIHFLLAVVAPLLLWFAAASTPCHAQELDSLRPGMQTEEQLERQIRKKREERREDSRQMLKARRPNASGSNRKLGESEANYVMRAGTSLSGIVFGSTSTADVNGDGNQDLLITGQDADDNPTATLYLGDGQASFTEAGADLTGVQFSSSSIADVNGDGNKDLLIAGIAGTVSNGDPSTALYLGDGQGGFTEADADLADVDASSTSIADVDGDGNQDLLITGKDANDTQTATLYLGDGQGGFTIAGAGLTGIGHGSTSIADVDGDGNKDLLITGRGADLDPRAILYLGDGQGGFTEANAGLTDVSDSSTSIADINKDGNEDLLIIGRDTNVNQTATLYLGDGQGGFTKTHAGLAGAENGSTSIADVDGDGNQDLLITGEDANLNDTATLYLGNGQGGFSEANAGLTKVDFSSASIADIGGDGDPDLLIAGSGDLFNEASARLYVNRTNQTPPNLAPRFSRTFATGSLAPDLTLSRKIEVGDPDGDAIVSVQSPSNPNASVSYYGDGIAEVTFTPDRNQGGDVVNISLEANDSDGATGSVSLPVEVSPTVAAFPASLAGVRLSSTSIGDVDEDGNQDLLITGEALNETPTTRLYLGDGQGGFAEAGAGLIGVDRGSTSIADVDDDGKKDLLITGWDANKEPTATLYLGDGQGGFTEAGAGLTDVAFSSTSIADVDGDGNQDLLITGEPVNNNPVATLYLGDGQGGFTEADASLTGVWTSSASIADVDGDGNKDLLIAGNSGTFSNENPTTTLYLGNGQGGFSESGVALIGVWTSSTSIADVNGDGNQDLLITGNAGGTLSDQDPTATLYLGNGQGGFAEADAGLAGVEFGSTSVADVDGDGNQDLLIAGDAGTFGNKNPTTTLYLGDEQGGFTDANAGLAGVEFGSTSVADVDGDADPDLLVAGFSSTSRSVSSILYENLFDDPLPVELAGFDAAADGKKVRLNWQTASEANNAGFKVQRKAKGQAAWEEVGFVESKASDGTTTETRSYRFTDTGLPYEADALTYRLKQIDTDGTVHFSEEVTVERGVTDVELLGTYPNPVQSQATVRYALPETQDVTVQLYDVLGRQVRTVVSGKEEGRHEQRLDTSGLSSGVYFLRLEAGGQTRTQKLTVVQ